MAKYKASNNLEKVNKIIEKAGMSYAEFQRLETLGLVEIKAGKLRHIGGAYEDNGGNEKRQL